MYPVSQAFKKAIYEDTRDYYLSGQLKLTDGRIIAFTGDDVRKNSLCIKRQCVNGSEITLGAVYASQIQIALTSKIDRYALFDAELSLTYSLRLGNGTLEDVPLGIYYIGEPVRNYSYLELSGYDGMLFFDKELPGATNGSAYDILMLVCTYCGVVLGMTAEEIALFPNGKGNLRLYEDNDVSTCRDLLYYLGQVLGGFFYIGRDGKLYLKGFGIMAADTIPHKHRFKTKFADYVTRYTAVKYENVESGTIEYHNIEPDDGLTMDLEQNPFLQGERGKLADALVEKISAFRYVPFECTFSGNPALDPGDVVQFAGGHADETQISCITHYDFKFRGNSILKCVGKNPRLMGVMSKTEKNLANLKNSVKGSTLTIVQYINAKEHTIGQGETEIIYIEFVTTSGTNAEFKATVLMDVTAAGILTAKYYVNDSLVTDFLPMQSLTPGKFILNLYYPLMDVPENKRNTFRAALTMDAGAAAVGRGQARAVVSGQGFAAGATEWNGNLDFEESIALFTPNAAFIGFTDTLETGLVTPHERAITEHIGLFTPMTAFIGFTDAGVQQGEIIKEVVTSNTITQFSSDSKYVIIDEESARLRTAYERASVAGTIDRGYLERLDLTSEWRRIDAVEINVEVIKEPEVSA